MRLAPLAVLAVVLAAPAAAQAPAGYRVTHGVPLQGQFVRNAE